MQQFELDRAFDELKFVKTRLTSQAGKLPLAQRRAALEMVGIINTAMLAAHEAGKDAELTFPVEEFTSK